MTFRLAASPFLTRLFVQKGDTDRVSSAALVRHTGMNISRTITAVGALAALALPAAAVAKPDAPTGKDKSNASRECKTLRGTTDASREAFAAQFKNLGQCVSQKAKEERTERATAKRSASKECKALRGEAGSPERMAFDAQFKNLGQCVSQNARQNKREEDADDAEETEERKNAAQVCDEQRGETPESQQAFQERFGKNRNDRNAFGKCVSEQARA